MGERMTILVTGGMGRLGRHLVKKLLSEGERVRIFSSKNKIEDEVREYCEGAEIFCGDVRNMRSVTMALSGVDTVYHLAAIVDPYAQKEKLYGVNVSGSRNIFQASMEKRAEVVFCSSIAAMGDVELNANENSACNPIDAYGKTKYEAEMIMGTYFRKGLKGAIVRPGDIYGVGFEEGYGKVLKMLKNKKFIIPGDGNNHIPLVNVNDVIEGMIKARKNIEKSPNEKYLLVAPEKTLNYILGISCEILGVEMPKQHIPVNVAKAIAWLKMKQSNIMGVESSITPHHIYILTKDRTYNTQKAKEKINWEAKIDLKYGIKEVVNWLGI